MRVRSLHPPHRVARLSAWLILVFVAAIIAMLIYRAVANLQAIRAEIFDFQIKLERVQQHRKDPSRLAQMIETLKKDPSTTKGYIEAATLEEASSVLDSAITAAVVSQQLQVLSLRRLPQVQDGPATALRVEFGFVGRSSAIVPLLRTIETTEHTLLVEEMSLNKNSEGLVSARLVVTGFWVLPS